METINNYSFWEWAKFLSIIFTIFGWGIILIFAINRFYYFKRRIFLLLIVIGISIVFGKIDELILNNLSMEKSSWFYQLAQWCLMPFALYIIYIIVEVQDKLDKIKNEKDNINIP